MVVGKADDFPSNLNSYNLQLDMSKIRGRSSFDLSHLSNLTNSK
jgi:hypothetical protein